jgi:hypothetical protein
MSPMHEITDALFMALLLMDAEATPTPDGHATGLSWYGKHRHPQQVKPKTEPSWTQRLEELLEDAGFETYKEISYPEDPAFCAKRLCDNVVVFPDQSVMWMENKGAWKEWWRQQGKVGKFRSHLMESGNSALHDVEKVAPLCEPHAQWLGILLLGFDSSAAPMEPDVAEFAARAQIDCEPWVPASMHWPDRWRPGERVHAWFWWRAAPQAPSQNSRAAG